MGKFRYKITVDFSANQLKLETTGSTIGATSAAGVSGNLPIISTVRNGELYTRIWTVTRETFTTSTPTITCNVNGLGSVVLGSFWRYPNALLKDDLYLQKTILSVFFDNPNLLELKSTAPVTALDNSTMAATYLPKVWTLQTDGIDLVKTGTSADATNINSVLAQFQLTAIEAQMTDSALGTVDILVADLGLNDSSNAFSNVFIADLPPPFSLSFTKTDVSFTGLSDGTIDLSIVGGDPSYTYTYQWLDGAVTQDRTGLAIGLYSVVVTETTTLLTQNVQIPINEAPIIPLTATISKTDVTVNGGSDGTLSVSASGGSGNYTYAWDDSVVTTATRTDLVADIYRVTVSDLTTSEVVVLSIGITQPVPDDVEPPPVTDPDPEPDPDAEPIIDPFFEVPVMQSLHFVRQETVDDCDTFATLDNQLICDQENSGFTKEVYLQKFRQCDSFNIQVKSPSNNFVGQLLDADGNVTYVTVPELKRSLKNVLTEVDVTIVTHFDAATNENLTQSRVYFTGLSDSPIPNNYIFRIESSDAGYSGLFRVVSVGYDDLRDQEYLVINLSSISQPESNAVISYNDVIAPYDIYELSYSFGGTEYGTYQARIISVYNGVIYNSEPILIKDSHKKTNYITWTNNDNAYNIDYTTGIVHKARIDSLFFKRTAGAIRDTLRNTNNSLAVLSSKPIRKLTLETVALPPYLHEKLSIVFEHDKVFIQGQQFVTDEGYEAPTYLDRSYKGNSSIVLEQVGWLESTYNGDDLGGVDEQDDLLIINEGFLKI